MNKLVVLLLLIIMTFFGARSFLFVVGEGRQAIITQFGKPIGEPITKAGLHLKKPFIHEVRFVDKRIRSWDGYPNQIPTKDKKYIEVDTTARWKVVNALTFIQTVRNERDAKARLDAILDSTTRDVISKHNLVEAVRNSNGIIAKTQARKDVIIKLKESGEQVVEEEITGEIEKIDVGREKLSEMIVEASTSQLKDLGIELIDVQLRRISYEEEVERKVYERMISERKRIAEKIRSIGQGEKAKIKGRLQKDLAEIESNAYKKAQFIRGKGEAEAAAIYTKSLQRDPKFYEFVRTMELYKDSLKGSTKYIMSADSDIFSFLKGIK